MLTIVVSEKDVVVNIDGTPVIISKSSPNYGSIRQAIIDDDAERVLSLTNLDSYDIAVEEYTADYGDVEFKDGKVYYKGEELHNELTRRMAQMAEEGFPVTSYINFLEKLMQNPSYNSRQQLYLFLEDHKLPISEDGDILAYKGVTDDYMDCHTRSFDNSVGNTHEMPRSEVDDNTNNGCSKGFHAGSEAYATGFGSRTVIVKINPKDCVSVPHRETAKLRCCKYTVVAEYTRTLDRACYANDAQDLVSYFKDNYFPGDEIYFYYDDEDRHVFIEHVGEDSITCKLMHGDPSFSYTEPKYRTFKIEKMVDIDEA